MTVAQTPTYKPGLFTRKKRIHFLSWASRGGGRRRDTRQKANGNKRQGLDSMGNKKQAAQKRSVPSGQKNIEHMRPRFDALTDRSATQHMCYVPNAQLCAHRPSFLVRPWRLFSRSRLRGTQGGRVYTRRKSGPRPGSVARALGVTSRANWQVITGLLSAEPEPRKTMETSHLNLLVFAQLSVTVSYLSDLYHTVPQTLKLSTLWQPRYNSSQSHMELSRL